jgi:uncharacterized damage-inducible protein DinB
MNLADYLRREFSYDTWANQETLAAIGKGGQDPRALALMAHILSAERLWLERLQGAPQSRRVWPEYDLGRCQSEVAELARLWPEYLAARSPEDFDAAISYKNSKGEPWTNTIIDVLSHVILHSAYHRGQIASHMRQSGQIPASTDFIHAVRQKLLT